jgi:hypothetical protein
MCLNVIGHHIALKPPFYGQLSSMDGSSFSAYANVHFIFVRMNKNYYYFLNHYSRKR